MRAWMLFTCLLASQANAADAFVTVYIDDRPPLGHTYSQWHAAVMDAVADWVVTAGGTTRLVDDPSEAGLVFRTGDTKDYLGYTRTNWRAFPSLPAPGRNQAEITVSVCLPDCCSLRGLLLHEVGHALGLDHEPNSVMDSPEDNPLAPPMPRVAFTSNDRRRLNQLASEIARLKVGGKPHAWH